MEEKVRGTIFPKNRNKDFVKGEEDVSELVGRIRKVVDPSVMVLISSHSDTDPCMGVVLLAPSRNLAISAFAAIQQSVKFPHPLAGFRWEAITDECRMDIEP